MIGVWNGLRALAGDALIAIGTTLQKPRNEFDEFLANQYLMTAGRMECDGPDATDIVCCQSPNLCGMPADCPGPSVGTQPIDLPDSEVLRTAAHIIAGWRPLLLRGAGTDYDVDELDEFVDLLRDRAHQFAAIQADEKNVFPPSGGK